MLRDRYEILASLGEGSEGRVVRALDHMHGRNVALKIRPAPPGAQRDELLREARVLLSLQPHPGLPLVREDFFEGDDYIIVMDWVDGSDLARLLRDEGNPGLAPSTVLRYLAHVAEALGYLHGHEPAIVHGDVKPANIILTRGGNVVLVDFGIASAGPDRAGKAGTQGFVAPEVAAGERRSGASDVYSLAMTAFALLTGRAHTGGRAVWPSNVDADHARAFEHAIARGTATDPTQRPASAGEFLELLRAGWDAAIPTGVVTLCMTEIDDAARLWERHPHEMAAALVQHDAIVAQCVEAARGRVSGSAGQGDTSVSAFTSALDAVPAAVEIARRMDAAALPDGSRIAVRVGLHTGTADVRTGGDGPVANRARQVRDLAEAGQVFVSEVTAGLVRGHLPEAFELIDLGSHALGGSGEREHVYAVRAPSISAPPSPAECPYRGLLAFGPEDEDVYFGRDAAVDEVVTRITRDRFAAVVGASGSGKSSLVRAGLIPRVRRGAVNGLDSAVVITPGDQPVRSLAAVLPLGDDCLLVVDQLEELFTSCTDVEARSRFVESLLGVPGKVLVSLRADFFGHCAVFPDLAKALSVGTLLLAPMQPDEMRAAIELPARTAGLTLGPGLVDLIMRDSMGEPGALPLLSHALMETWTRRDGRTLTIAGYHDAGGVREAIARTAEDVYLAGTDAERAALRAIFLRLTELGEGTEDTRRRVPLAEFASSPRDLLDKLTAARLLIVDDGSAEVAHEALIRGWPRLRTWLNEDREGLRVQRHLTRSAQAWEAMGSDPSELYRGARLAAALDRSAEIADMSALERRFLEASHAGQDAELRVARRRNRRLKISLGGVATALIVAIVAGGVALGARGNAQRSAILAQSGHLAAQSREAAGQHPDLGLLLALESERLHPSVETRGALLGALEHAGRLAAQLHGLTAPPSAVAFTRDGKILASAGVDGTTLWDVTAHRPLGAPLRSDQGGWEGLDFSPDGHMLAIGGGHGVVELWDVATKREVRALTSPLGIALQSVGFSPDGKVLAASGREDNHIVLFDVRSGRALEPIAAHAPGTSAGGFAFSPDSARILVIGDDGMQYRTIATGGPGPTSFGPGAIPARLAVFTRDGRRLVALDDSGAISTWDARSGAHIGEPIHIGDRSVASLDISPDGRLIAAGMESGEVLVWDAVSGAPFGTPLTADATPVWDIAFSPDSRLVGSVHGRSVALWDMSGDHAIGRPLGRITDAMSDVAFRPDGKRIAAARFDSTIAIYDAATRNEVASIPVGSIPYTVRYSPDGRLIAVGSIDGSIRFWDADTYAPAGRPLNTGKAFVWQIAFNRAGTLLAAAVDPNGPRDIYQPDRQGEAQLWDVATRTRVGKPMVPGKHSILSVAFSPDGAVLATGSFEERTELWNVSDQTPLGKTMDLKEDGIAVVAFAPDGRRLVAAGVGVRIWNAGTQELALPPFASGADPVAGASFDPTGRFLATTSLASATRLWDPATGIAYGDELLAAPWPPSSQPEVDVPLFPPVRNAFSPDGRLLVSAGVQARPMVWNLDPATWRARACDIAGRNLSREEWRVYLPAGTPYRPTCAGWPAI